LARTRAVEESGWSCGCAISAPRFGSRQAPACGPAPDLQKRRIRVPRVSPSAAAAVDVHARLLVARGRRRGRCSSVSLGPSYAEMSAVQPECAVPHVRQSAGFGFSQAARRGAPSVTAAVIVELSAGLLDRVAVGNVDADEVATRTPDFGECSGPYRQPRCPSSGRRQVRPHSWVLGRRSTQASTKEATGPNLLSPEDASDRRNCCRRQQSE